MTGEMHQSEVMEENFPLHFAIAEAMNGTVHAFDQYQGPYVLVPGGKLWLSSDDGIDGYIYNERNGCKSEEFPANVEQDANYYENLVAIARTVI